MKFGSIYLVNFSPANPPEFGKTRPAIVVSNSEQNLLLPTIVVVPLSSQAPEIWPLRMKVAASFLDKTSYAVLPGIRQVSKQRLEKLLGFASNSAIEAVKEAIAVYLSE